jgi:hypothetical protein
MTSSTVVDDNSQGIQSCINKEGELYVHIVRSLHGSLQYCYALILKLTIMT